MLSLILPARNWHGDRIEACVRSFLRLKSKTLAEIVVVDFGSREPIALKVRDKRVRIVRVEAERWSLAEAINVGVVASTNPVVAKTDADIVIARESGPGLDAAVAAIASGGIGLAVVQAVDLPPGTDAETALAESSPNLLAAGRLRPRWGQGGLCLFAADTWDDIGGFESRYHGWGNEDNDFANRIRRSGRRMQWIKGDAVRIFHVWHPPTHAVTDIVKARSANQSVFNDDKSTFRPIRFLHSKRRSHPRPNAARVPGPLVTVGIASKARPGRERMLGEAIRGFAGQIDNDFEVLIADNGSTPEEGALLRKFLAKLPRSMNVRVIDIAEPSIPRARNRITDEARGRYICVADDDDIPLPERLADHLVCFERDPAIHGSHGGWIDFDELTGVIDYNTGGERRLETMLFGRGKVTAHPASFYRRDAMRAVRYDESIKAGSDLDLAVRMANIGLKIGHTGSYVTLRRFHALNITITDLFGQVSVGIDARQRVTGTLGSVLEWRMRQAGKAAPANVACANTMGKDSVIGLLPGYVGLWRLLLPLADLGKRRRPESSPGTVTGIATNGSGETHLIAPPNGGTLPNPPGLFAVAEELAGAMAGDVEVVDGGIDPAFYFVSTRIKGAKSALKLRSVLEERFQIGAEMIPDVEYQSRRIAPFDWSALAKEAQAGRLVSKPIKQLDKAMAALAKVPNNTALRAMTSILADFNCTEQRFHLITVPIRTAEGPRGVKRILEKQTGETFLFVGESDMSRQRGRPS